MSKSQNFSFTHRKTHSTTTMHTISELDQAMDKRKTKNFRISPEISQANLRIKDPKYLLEKSIYEVPNEILLKELRKDPFLMRKLKLVIENQIRKNLVLEQEQNPYYRKMVPNTLSCTSYREQMEVKRRSNREKMAQLAKKLKFSY